MRRAPILRSLIDFNAASDAAPPIPRCAVPGDIAMTPTFDTLDAAAGARARSQAQGRDRQLRRRCRRLVRLPAVRDRRRAGIQFRVLPESQPDDGHARGVRDLRRRLPVPAARRRRVRPLRRPARPQADAGADRDADGAVDGRDRPAAGVLDDRLVGARAAGADARDPGFRGRRRMGRRGADGRRKRAEAEEGVLQQRRAGRLRRRPRAGHGHRVDPEPRSARPHSSRGAGACRSCSASCSC